MNTGAPTVNRGEIVSMYAGLYTTELANSPITDAPDDIVDSLSGSFQLDFVVYDASDGFRRRPIRFKN